MIENNKDGSGARLKEIRMSLGLSQLDMASKLGISNGHLSDLEKDRKNITEPTVKILAYEFNVNDDWLKTGKGEMFLSSDEKFAELSALIAMSDNDDVKELIEMLWKLDENELLALKVVVKSMQKK